MTKTRKQRQQDAQRMTQGRRAKAMKGRVSLAEWDHGATGAANRIGMVIEERGQMDTATGKVVNPNGVTGARRVDLLDFWHGRGTISTGGMNAAKLLRQAYEDTMRGPAALPDNHKVQSSPKPDQAIDIQIERISRFSRIMAKVEDRDRQIVSACVLDGHHPSHVSGPFKVRQGIKHLRDALDRLHTALGA